MGRRAGVRWAWVAAAVVAVGVVVFGRTPDATVPSDETADVGDGDATAADGLAGRRPPPSAPPVPTAEPAIPGATTGSVRLRVVRAPDSAPVPGIPVFLRRDAAARGPLHLLAWTDDRGEAVFPEVSPGADLRLRVQPGASADVERDGFVVVAGVTTDLGDVRLGPLGVIDALVVDGAGVPVEDARVVATLDPATVESLDDDPFPLAADPPRPVAAGRSDNHGRVRLEGVPPGLVAVRATKALLRGATDRVRVPAAGPDSAVVTIVLSLSTGIGLFVIDTERPVEGAPVRVGDERLDGFVARAATVTDGAGLASLTGFSRYVRADVEVSMVGRGTFGLYRVPVGGLFRLTFPAFGPRTFEVVDGDGAPVVGARVGARAAARCHAEGLAPQSDDAPPRARPLAGDVRVDAVGVTDDAGRVTLDVGDAEPEVWALHPDYLAYGDPPALAPTSGSTRGSRQKPARRGMRPADATRVVLSRGITVRGTVDDAQGRHVVGAVVEAVDDGGRALARATSDERGEYALAPVRPERTAWIVGRRGDPVGAGRRRLTVEPPVEDVAAFRLVVGPPSRLRGAVRGVGGAPVVGARVELVGTALVGLPAPWVLTGADGRFVLAPLPDVAGGEDRRLEVVASRVGLGSERRIVLRPAGFGLDLDGGVFHLGRGKDVEGSVVDGERRAVPFPIVELLATGLADADDVGRRTLRRFVAADEFGRFVARDVQPGTYRVRASARGLEGYARDPVEVSPSPGVAPKVVPVIVEAAIAVTGSVVDGFEGEPVAGAVVTLVSRLPAEMSATGTEARQVGVTDARGRFGFATAGTPERLEVQAEHPAFGRHLLRARENLSPRACTDLRIRLR